MTEKDRIFMDVILSIEAQRGDVMIHPRGKSAISALDDLEDEIRHIAKSHGVSIPDPS